VQSLADGKRRAFGGWYTACKDARVHRKTDAGTDATSKLRVEVTPKTMIVAALVVLGAWIALRLAAVALVVVLALLLVGTVSPAVAWLEKRKVKRPLGIALVFGSMLLVVAGALALTVPALVEQVVTLVRAEPVLRGRLVGLLSRARATAPLADTLRSFDYGALARGSLGTALEYSTRSMEVVAYLLSAVFLALYAVIDRDRLRGGLYAVVPRHHHLRLTRVLLNLEVIVGGYIRGQVLTSVLMAIFTFALLSLCGVKAALALGVLAGLADVLPYIGVLLAVGPAAAAAVSQGPVTVGIVVAAMLAYEEFESRVLVPKIYGKALKLPPSMVLFALLVGGTLLGIPGAFLALPVAAALRMLVEELRIDLPGEEAERPSLVAQDARAEREYERRVEGVPATEAAAIAVEISKARRDTAEPDSAT
jgi:putative heme transporter